MCNAVQFGFGTDKEVFPICGFARCRCLRGICRFLASMWTFSVNSIFLLIQQRNFLEGCEINAKNMKQGGATGNNLVKIEKINQLARERILQRERSLREFTSVRNYSSIVEIAIFYSIWWGYHPGVAPPSYFQFSSSPFNVLSWTVQVWSGILRVLFQFLRISVTSSYVPFLLIGYHSRSCTACTCITWSTIYKNLQVTVWLSLVFSGHTYSSHGLSIHPELLRVH